MKDGKMDIKNYIDKGTEHVEAEKNAGRKAEDIPVDKIRPNPFQPRKAFDEKKLKEFAEQLKKDDGIYQPITVRPAQDPEHGAVFEIVMGERRFRATIIAGFKTIPAFIKETSDAKMKTRSVVENVQRAPLNYVETMDGYSNLLSEHGDAEGIAAAVGKDKRTIEKYLKAHEEINSVPEIRTQVDVESKDISLTALLELGRLMPGVRRLQKSNKREFEIVCRQLQKGIEKKLPWLKKKVSGTNGAKQIGPHDDGMFRETDKEFILAVRIKKGERLNPEIVTHIKVSIDKFMDTISCLNSETEVE